MWSTVDNPTQFREMELEVAQLGRQMADAITAEILKSRVADPELQANCTQAVKTHSSLRSGGQRKVQVTLLGGQQVECQVEYYKPNRRTSKGRRRRTGRRGKGGAGLYPVLAALGIWFGVTPALAAEVCRQVTDRRLGPVRAQCSGPSRCRSGAQAHLTARQSIQCSRGRATAAMVG